jgi:hypothetical protein
LYNSTNTRCPFDNSTTIELQVRMICDPNVNNPIISAAYADNACNMALSVTSKKSCYDFSINPLITFMGEHSTIFGVTLILLGLVLGIMGKRFFKICLFVTGSTVLTLASTLFVFSAFLNRDTSNTLMWILFSVCLVVSMIGGLLLAKFFRFGIAVAAGWGGVALALILYNAFIYKIDNSNKIVFWIFIVLMAVACAALSFKFCWPAVIIATSIAGAYSLIRGISVMAGGYPNELEIIRRIEDGDLSGMPGAFYGYMAGFFVLAIAFMVWQFKRYGLEDESKKDGQK